MRTCRFCKKHAGEAELIKYGVRHYAHADCFFQRIPEPIEKLRDWQILSVPYRLLKKHGLLSHPRVTAAAAKINAEIGNEPEEAMSYRVVYGETMPAWEKVFPTLKEAKTLAKEHEGFGDIIFSIARVVPGEKPTSFAAAIDAGMVR